MLTAAPRILFDFLARLVTFTPLTITEPSLRNTIALDPQTNSISFPAASLIVSASMTA